MSIIGKPDLRINFKKADSKSKEFAFIKASELNNMEKFIQRECPSCKGNGCNNCHGYGHIYERVYWRVGKNTSDRLAVEIDTHDKGNLESVISNLRRLFGYEFNLITTKHGYHIVSKNILTFLEWETSNCIVLNNALNQEEMFEYKSKILKLDEDLRNTLYTTDYKKLLKESMEFNGLLNCVGDFDILYTLLSLKFGKSTLRISKKSKEDKYEEVKY